MIIVLEGTEAVGKTTLADELTELWHDLPETSGSQVLHAGPPAPTPSVYEQYAAPLRDERFRACALDPSWLIVLDRYHLGDLVYGPVLRDGPAINAEQLRHLELTLDALGALRVVLAAGEDELHERMGPHREDLIDADKACELNGVYLDLAHRLGWAVTYPSLHYGTELAMELIGKARVLNVAAAPLAGHPGYVGAPRPTVLFVGDQPGGGWVPGDPGRPAFDPGDAAMSSARYLLRALESAGTSLTYGLCNANDGTDLPGLMDALRPAFVVGLGRAAQQELSQLGVVHTDAPHPQWVRRFKHATMEEYGRDLFFGEPVRR